MGLYQIKSEEKFMRSPFFISVLLALSLRRNAGAQLYDDASANLPNNGARGPSMDVRAADLDNDGDLDLSKGYAVLKYQICI